MNRIGRSLLRRFFRASHGGERGAAMIEFALVLPVLVVLLLGMVEFGEAFSVTRKITAAASTVSDLVAQNYEVSDADLNDIVAVADELIKPYDTAQFGLVITSAVAGRNNTITAGWSFAKGKNATAHVQGAAIPLPHGLTEPGASVIMVETIYEYRPPVGLFLLGTRNLGGTAYFRPRRTKVIARIGQP